MINETEKVASSQKRRYNTQASMKKQKELEEKIRNWLWRKSNEPNQGFAETGHQGIE